MTKYLLISAGVAILFMMAGFKAGYNLAEQQDTKVLVALENCMMRENIRLKL